MRALDLAVILAYLAGITWFGARFRRSQRTLKDYFLGGKTAPWWAITFSIVSTETSTLTVIGTPALAFTGNFGFLQVVFGYLLGRIVIAVLFLPHYFRGEMYTAYELIERRFGERLRRLTAGAFLLLRALAEGVRVFAISLVVSIVLGTGEFASILLIICLTLFYTFEGGLKAVIWTEVVQMLLYIAGALASLAVLVQLVPEGWHGIWEAGQAAGKFQVFDFSLPRSGEYFARTYTFWAGLLGGCFLNTASHGAEQLIVQRLLAARNLRDSRLALLASWVVVFLQFALFLLIGVALYAFYGASGLQAPQPADRIYPEFVWRHLPPGIAGLVIAAILAAAMSTHSATLNALASTTVMDFWRPLASARGSAPLSDAAALRLARGVTVVWEAVMLLIAWLARKWGPVLEAGLSIASVLYGSLLGAFLLGLLTRRAGPNAATVGMLAGLLVMLYIKAFTPVAWTWYALIGAATTFLAGWIVAIAFREPVHA